MPLSLAEASAKRRAEPETDLLEVNTMTLFAHYEKVDADPRKMGYLRFLVKHYAKSPHPWHDCYKDNFKRFGPKTPALCGVLKDIIRQRTDWRGKGPRPNDHGSPGVAIGEADKGAANPPWGPWMHTKMSDDYGINAEVLAMIQDVVDQCDPCRVLMGLDDAPRPSATYLSSTHLAHDLIFYEHRSTPEVVTKGAKGSPKANYGRQTRRRAATADEEKKISSGDWLRVDSSGKKPSDSGYRGHGSHRLGPKVGAKA